MNLQDESETLMYPLIPARNTIFKCILDECDTTKIPIPLIILTIFPFVLLQQEQSANFLELMLDNLKLNEISCPDGFNLLIIIDFLTINKVLPTRYEFSLTGGTKPQFCFT